MTYEVQSPPQVDSSVQPKSQLYHYTWSYCSLPECHHICHSHNQHSLCSCTLQCKIHNIFTVILYASEKINYKLFYTILQINPWLTSLGYSLCYGTILIKMVRVWSIFSKPLGINTVSQLLATAIMNGS